jgi:hypothetical protein
MTSLKSHQRILGLALCFSLFTATAAWARFNPKPTTPIGPMTTGGTRGCAAETPLAFTALAPLSTITELTADQAIVAWYSPDRAAYQITLNLYEAVAPGTAPTPWKLVKQVDRFENEEGVKFYRLPAELLQEGKVYTWQAVLECVPGYPSADIVAEAQFKVVAAPSDLQKQLNKAADARSRAELYRSAGLWYSALAEAEPSRAIQLELLKDLITYEQAQTAPSPWLELGHKHSESLTKIVEKLSQR